MIEAKSWPMENTGKKNPVKKETFEKRMNERQEIEQRIDKIEKKQAERFPMLLKRLDKLEEDILKLTKTVYNIKKWTK
jgi:hypothetical protein